MIVINLHFEVENIYYDNLYWYISFWDYIYWKASRDVYFPIHPPAPLLPFLMFPLFEESFLRYKLWEVLFFIF